MKKYNFPGIIADITKDIRHILIYNSYGHFVWMPGKYHGVSIDKLKSELKLLEVCMNKMQKINGGEYHKGPFYDLNESRVYNLYNYIETLILLKEKQVGGSTSASNKIKKLP